MATSNYGDLQSKTYGDLANLTYAFENTNNVSNSEYTRRIDYWTSSQVDESTGMPLINGTVAYPDAPCGNIRLFIRNDAHLNTYARTDGHDIHFVTENGTELPFELVYYGNGTGEWWIKVGYVLGTSSDLHFYMKYGYDGAWFDNSSMIWCNDQLAFSNPTELAANSANISPPLYPVIHHTKYYHSDLISQVVYSGGSLKRYYNSVKFYGDSHYNGYTHFDGGSSWESNYPTYSALGNPCDYATLTSVDVTDTDTEYEYGEDPFADDRDGHLAESILFGVAIRENTTGRTGYAQILSFRGITVAYNETTGINFYCGSHSSPYGFGISANPPQGCLILIEVGRLIEVPNSNPTEYSQTFRISYRGSVDYGGVLVYGTMLTTGGTFPSHDLGSNNAPPAPQILERWRCRTGIGDNEELNYDNTNVSYMSYSANGYYAMLFHNEAIRTIGDPAESVTPTPTPSTTSPFFWMKSKTYQGLAGGCN